MLDRAGMKKSQLLMKRDAAAIGKVDAANHHVILLLLRGLDQFAHERQTDAFAAMILVYVDGVLDRVLVGRPCTEATVARETQQSAIFGDSADHGIPSCLFCVEPSHHAFRGTRLVIIDSG